MKNNRIWDYFGKHIDNILIGLRYTYEHTGLEYELTEDDKNAEIEELEDRINIYYRVDRDNTDEELYAKFREWNALGERVDYVNAHLDKLVKILKYSDGGLFVNRLSRTDEESIVDIISALDDPNTELETDKAKMRYMVDAMKAAVKRAVKLANDKRIMYISNNYKDLWKTIRYYNESGLKSTDRKGILKTIMETAVQKGWGIKDLDKQLDLGIKIKNKDKNDKIITKAMDVFKKYTKDNMLDIADGIWLRDNIVLPAEISPGRLIHLAIVERRWSATHARREFVMYAAIGKENVKVNTTLKNLNINRDKVAATVDKFVKTTSDTITYPWRSKQRVDMIRRDKVKVNADARRFYKDKLYASLPAKYLRPPTKRVGPEGQIAYGAACKEVPHSKTCKRTKKAVVDWENLPLNS